MWVSFARISGSLLKPLQGACGARLGIPCAIDLLACAFMGFSLGFRVKGASRHTVRNRLARMRLYGF